MATTMKNVLGGFEGTCWSEEKNNELYRCYKNENPLISQPQIVCEWKVQRALGRDEVILPTSIKTERREQTPK